MPSGRKSKARAGLANGRTDESRGQMLISARLLVGEDIEHDLMTVEVDDLGLLARAVRDGDLRSPGLADDFTRCGLETVRDGHAVVGMEADDLELHLHVAAGARAASSPSHRA